MAHATDAMASSPGAETGVCTDMPDVSQVLGLLNGEVRSITALRSLLDQAGWKIITVHRDPPSVARFQKVTAVPN